MTPAEETLAAKYGIDPRYYVIRGQRLIELHPDRCPAGHPLRGGRYVVGWRACLCVDGHTGHRLWICDCGEETGGRGVARAGLWFGVGWNAPRNEPEPVGSSRNGSAWGEGGGK